MIRLNNIRFSYPGGAVLFDSFSWFADAGEHWAVVGPSGCGKTTLLKLLAGLLKPASGTIEIDGQCLGAPLPENGLVFQDYELLPWATVVQNVELGLRIRAFQGQRADERGPLKRKHIRERAAEWIRALGLQDIRDRYPNQISGGQRQRTAIARTLATDARRLLMDEPFSALDFRTRESLRKETLNLCRQNTLSLVLVTHSIEEAVLMGQKILVLRPGPPISGHIVPNPHQGVTLDETECSWRERCLAVRECLG